MFAKHRKIERLRAINRPKQLFRSSVSSDFPEFLHVFLNSFRKCCSNVLSAAFTLRRFAIKTNDYGQGFRFHHKTKRIKHLRCSIVLIFFNSNYKAIFKQTIIVIDFLYFWYNILTTPPKVSPKIKGHKIIASHSIMRLRILKS